MTKDINKRITIVKICFITVPQEYKRYHVPIVQILGKYKSEKEILFNYMVKIS